MAYYDGTKLLSLSDINGAKPELYLCTTNRTGGKTTWFSRFVVNKFFKGDGKFGLVYRFNYEVDDCADKFFKDIGGLFFPTHTMTSKRKASGSYHELYLDGVSCGYAFSLNCADQLKKYSHLFSDCNRLLFDEFQSETNHYCPNEIKKFQSIHTTISRGQGKQKRYVPVYMIANPVSLINPYYCALRISSRLKSDTKFLRGDGWVLEQGFVQSAADAQLESGVFRAFADDSYSAYSSQGIYLNDNYAFIDKPKGVSRYVCTLKYDGGEYAIREYPQMGIMYCDNRVDTSFAFKIAVTTDDHNINYIMLKNNDFFLKTLRFYFERGCFRFKDLKCKEALITALSI